MSLLLASGHTEAIHYTLGQLYDEANLVIERENNRITTEATLVQLAVGSLISDKARKAFTARQKELNITVKPRRGLFDNND